MLRRSFGSGDGAGNKGGAMLRSVHRAVRAGGGATPETLSRPTSPTGNTTPPRPTSNIFKPKGFNTLSVSNSNATTSSPFCNPCHVPMSTWPYASDSSEFDDWEYVESSDVDDGNHVFGSVPSVQEVQHAVSSIQQVLDPGSCQQVITDNAANNLEKDIVDQVSSPTGFLHRVPSYGSGVDWMEPSLPLCNASLSKPFGYNGLYDALHLLQTEPYVQKMVISLSSDKAVWDAVLNNEVVQEIKQSLAEAGTDVSLSSVSSDDSDDSETSVDILSWIFVNMKTTIMGLVDKITNMMDGLFLPPRSANKTEQAVDSFEEKLKTSFLLSIVVFLIVVVGRASRS